MSLGIPVLTFIPSESKYFLIFSDTIKYLYGIGYHINRNLWNVNSDPKENPKGDYKWQQ